MANTVLFWLGCAAAVALFANFPMMTVYGFAAAVWAFMIWFNIDQHNISQWRKQRQLQQAGERKQLLMAEITAGRPPKR